ncbi:MAG: helix-turn-helix transcriptional regulator [Dehalococcoidia bacterium]|nr:helix-turn-helix transcriptional regulator [Dehalococcoidia bacterium]
MSVLLLAAVEASDRYLSSRPGPPAETKARLSPREAAVLELLVQGATNKEIARALVISPRTVERHLANVYGRIGARGRADAIAWALRT